MQLAALHFRAVAHKLSVQVSGHALLSPLEMQED